MAVFAALDMLHPLAVSLIPLDGDGKASIKIHLRRPARQTLELFTAERVTPVMSWAVCYPRDQGLRFMGGLQDAANHFDIGKRAVPADVVNFAGLAFLQHAENGTAVIFYIEPVAYLLAIAVDGEGLLFQSV